MASKYKINRKAILTDSDGTRDLIAESVVYEDSFTATNTIRSLSPDYFEGHFGPSNPFQGGISGYASGGKFPQFTSHNNIQKFSFTTDANATDVGDLTRNVAGASGQSSFTHGYTSGPSIIDKFTFSSDANATDVGDLTVARGDQAGQSSTNSGFGYASGEGTVIDKFPFAADTNATDVGDLTISRQEQAGQSSSTHGYNAGTNPPYGTTDTIDKFPFSTDANATDVGDTTAARIRATGQSSDISGYVSGGGNLGPSLSAGTTIIDKFPFAVDANSTDVGDLTQARAYVSGQSSTQSGYTSGGWLSPPFTGTDTIDKFPFSSDANAADVGNLNASRHILTGQQV